MYNICFVYILCVKYNREGESDQGVHELGGRMRLEAAWQPEKWRRMRKRKEKWRRTRRRRGGGVLKTWTLHQLKSSIGHYHLNSLVNVKCGSYLHKRRCDKEYPGIFSANLGHIGENISHQYVTSKVMGVVCLYKVLLQFLIS